MWMIASKPASVIVFSALPSPQLTMAPFGLPSHVGGGAAGIDGPAAGIDGPAIAASNFWWRRRGSVSDGRDAGCGHHASELKAEAKQGLPGLLRLSEKGHHARRLGLFFGRKARLKTPPSASNGDGLSDTLRWLASHAAAWLARSGWGEGDG